jgi:peptidoglycan hydrolase FlgJ
MAIKPSSDIVLEVLKAADPARAQAVTQKLTSLGAGGVEEADDFTKVLDAAAQPSASDADIRANAADMRDRLAALNPNATADQKTAQTQVEFEASILKTFVDAMLPKDETDVYGQGSAGDIWKSMLADQIAKQIARSGAFGISKHLFDTHSMPGRAHPTLAVSGALNDAAMRGANEAVMSPGAFLSSISKRS